MVKPVAIYADKGTSHVGVRSLEKACRYILQLPCKRVFAEDILQNQLRDYALLIIPGGADLPYCEKLNGAGNRYIKDFVANGGRYLGICAGAYYGCASLDFIGAEYRVSGSRELGFFEGVAVGSLPELTNGHYFDESCRSKAIVLLTLAEPFANFGSKPTACYYHGGCTFVEHEAASRWSKVLARYENGKAALVAGQFGQGRFVLSGVHFEIDSACYAAETLRNAPPAEAAQEEKAIYQQLQQNDTRAIWRAVAAALSLDMP